MVRQLIPAEPVSCGRQALDLSECAAIPHSWSTPWAVTAHSAEPTGWCRPRWCLWSDRRRARTTAGEHRGLARCGDAARKEIDQGEMVRYLSEMIWFPSAFLEDNVF